MTNCDHAPVSSPGPGADIFIPHGRRIRLRRQIERAEVLLVGRIVRDGGITSWRAQAEDRFRAARRSCVRGRIARTETVALVVALLDQPLRDRCWLRIEEDPDPAWIMLWTHLAMHSLPPFRAEPLFLLAWTAWRLDDMGVAVPAVQAARADEPHHNGAALLSGILSGGLRAFDLPSLATPERLAGHA